MPAIGTLVNFSAGQKLVSADMNSNLSAIRTAFNTSAVLSDTATTITVTHTWSVNQIFQSGILVSGASTFSSGVTFTTGTTITASGVTVAGNVVYSSTVTCAALTATRNVVVYGNVTGAGALNIQGALVVTGNATLGAALNVVGALVVTGNVTCGAALNVVGALVVTGNATLGAALNIVGAITATGATFSGLGLTTPVVQSATALNVLNGSGVGWVIATTTGKINHNGVAGVICANATLATAATTGFVYLSSINGTATGVPAGELGTIPVCIDVNGPALQAYIGGTWRRVALT